MLLSSAQSPHDASQKLNNGEVVRVSNNHKFHTKPQQRDTQAMGGPPAKKVYLHKGRRLFVEGLQHSGLRPCCFGQQQAEALCKGVAQLAAVHDKIEEAVFEHKLRALKALG